MRRTLTATVGAGALAVALLAGGTAAASPPQDPATGADGAGHDLPSPLATKQRAERQQALAQVLRGQEQPRGDNQVVEISPGQFVELAREDTDQIWTLTGEFADVAHNQIPEPDRSVDNSTIWTPDFSEQHYQDMLFSTDGAEPSMADYYDELSSGRYTVEGDVTDWVTLDGDAAQYGANTCGGIVCSNVWDFVGQTADEWYASVVGSGMTPAEVDAYLARFDVWDRYDYDGDGNFDEPDGYIDHFQAIHAGQGEETGGGDLGTDAIWSHRWYVQTNPIGSAGPTVAGTSNPQGGTEVGDSGYWIGDYTVEPENGGVGVFAHEFGHDLGLPDLYDTSGNTGGAENSTAFWTLMSSGSYGSSGDPEDAIGTKPTHMGAWEKLQLGWLDFATVDSGQQASVRLGPSAHATKQDQAVVVPLPDREVSFDIGTPYEGDTFFYSGNGNDLNATMSHPVTLTGSSTLTAQVRYAIEEDYDFAYVEVSTDGGSSWRSVPVTVGGDGTAFTTPDGLTGSSGDEWQPLSADLSGITGDALVRFRYLTDGAVVEDGLSVDAVAVDGAPLTDGWAFDGFTETTGTGVERFFNAYIAENRTYFGYDDGLRTGPYNFGFPDRPDLVEHYPYQDGVLVSYWNDQFADNNVGDHPGEGLVLPVDAHPTLLRQADGDVWRPRVQSYDSTFTAKGRTDRITLHDPQDGGRAVTLGGLPAVSTFDDTQDWYVEPGEEPGANGWSGVRTPDTGTVIEVLNTSGKDGQFSQVRVR